VTARKAIASRPASFPEDVAGKKKRRNRWRLRNEASSGHQPRKIKQHGRRYAKKNPPARNFVIRKTTQRGVAHSWSIEQNQVTVELTRQREEWKGGPFIAIDSKRDTE